MRVLASSPTSALRPALSAAAGSSSRASSCLARAPASASSALFLRATARPPRLALRAPPAPFSLSNSQSQARALSTSSRSASSPSPPCNSANASFSANVQAHALPPPRRPLRARDIAAGAAALALLLALTSRARRAVLLESAVSSAPAQTLVELETEAEESASGGVHGLSGRAPVPLAHAHLTPVRAEELTYVSARPFRHMAFGDLASRYVVFAMCGFPRLVEHAPALLDWALEGTGSRIPGVKWITEVVVRATFFKQFVGAESAQECVPLLAQLSRDNLGALFAFSVEMIGNGADGTALDLDQLQASDAARRARTRKGRRAAAAAQREAEAKGRTLSYSDDGPALRDDDDDDEDDAPRAPSKYIYDSIIDGLIESVDVAAAFAGRPAWADSVSAEEKACLEARPPRDGSTMVAIKLSGVLRDPSVLERASAAIVPRERFSAPPAPLPPSYAGAAAAGAALAIPISALQQARPEDVTALKELWAGLRRLARRAQKAQNVRLVVDAEYSWFQPAIDAMYEELAREFNRVDEGSGSKGKGARDAWYRRFWGRRLSASGEADNGATAVRGKVRGPLVFNTFQTYLRRTPSHLAASLERARAGGYTLGVKLVRGAYVEQENAQYAHKDVGTPPASGPAERELGLSAPLTPDEEWRSPVWRTKALTDRCFDGCAVRLVDEIAADMAKNGEQPHLAVIFATHNWQSALKVTRRMLETGLAFPPSPETLQSKRLEIAENASAGAGEAVSANTARPELVMLQVAPGVRGRICFGQLLGMADSLTRRLQLAFDPLSGGAGPHMVLKYIPYGSLSLVIPYLTRRAVENKSVMQGSDGQDGAAAYERKLAGREIRRRIFPFLF